MRLSLSRPTLLAKPFASAVERAFVHGELVQIRDYGLCTCCGGDCSYVTCSCCDTAPLGLVSSVYYISVATGTLAWDTSAHPASPCGIGDQDSYSPWTGPDAFVANGECAYIDHIEVDCNITAYFECDDGIWYLIFLVVNTNFSPPDGQMLKLQLESFDCCTATQTVNVTVIRQDEIYTDVPTQITITNLCPECPACETCGDPASITEATLVSNCPEYDGLVVPLTWDGGTLTATGSLELTAGTCSGCSKVVVDLACVAGVWVMSLTITNREFDPGCEFGLPATSETITDRCDTCLTIAGHFTYASMGDPACCTDLTIDVVITTCP